MKHNYSVIKKSLSAALVIGATLGGAQMAHAAGEATSQSYTIQLKADIPQTEFQVIPVEAGWITQQQTMEYDVVNKKLVPFEKEFQFKSTGGAIQAKFDTDNVAGAGAQLSNGKDTIPLTVSFNGKVISDTAQPVVDKDPAKEGGRAPLKITAGAVGTKTGSYTATVALLFEQVVTP